MMKLRSRILLIRIRMIVCLVIVSFLSNNLSAQEIPFNRGVNLTNWFQASAAEQIQFTKYTRQDFINIQSLGYDVIRLPINLHSMTNGEPDYLLDTLFLGFLDQAADWAEELKIHLILDNHTFNPSVDTDPGIEPILLKIWGQMAQHFVNRSEYIYYEILNEPHGISDLLWNNIQQSAVNKIREYDTIHYIIIGPAGWNSYNNLDDMPLYEEDKLIYTFHYYDPFIFTHQGASWTIPSMAPMKNVPFPYDPDSIPEFPPELNGTWIESNFNQYSSTGTIESVKALLDIAIQFRNQRGVPLFCGEFGVYIPNSYNHHRVFWYQTVRKYLEANGIPWTMWDYHGGFGLFKEHGNDLFEHDLNIPLLEALGLEIPEQTPYQRIPDSTGFMIYDDYIAHSIVSSSYSNGILDYYSLDHPNNGKYCIHWTGADQYRSIGFDFKPDRDLTLLVSEGFALDCIVRGDSPGISFDVRFLDSKTNDPDDLPWRMRVTVDNKTIDFNNHWQHLNIPLQTFTEHGAWYNEWFSPRGDFDWADIDHFEIVAEEQSLGNNNLWFDNIHITDLDTAQVFPDTTQPVNVIRKNFDETWNLAMFPNPTSGPLILKSEPFRKLICNLWELNGRMVKNCLFTGTTVLDLSDLMDGIYILKVSDDRGNLKVRKVIVQTGLPFNH